jgi:hypothetical protein
MLDWLFDKFAKGVGVRTSWYLKCKKEGDNEIEFDCVECPLKYGVIHKLKNDDKNLPGMVNWGCIARFSDWGSAHRYRDAAHSQNLWNADAKGIENAHLLEVVEFPNYLKQPSNW